MTLSHLVLEAEKDLHVKMIILENGQEAIGCHCGGVYDHAANLFVHTPFQLKGQKWTSL